MKLSLDLLALLLGNIAVLTTGVAAWRRNFTSGAARWFFLSTVAFVVWMTMNFVSIQDYGSLTTLELMQRITHVSGVWLMVVVWYFCYRFPTERRPSILMRVVSLAALLGGSAFSFSPLVVDHVVRKGTSFAIITGPGYPLYGVLLALLAAVAIFSLRRNYATSDLLQRNQIRYVAFGITMSISLGLFFNVGLATIVGPEWGSPVVNLLVAIPVVVFLGYGLIRHRYTEVHRLVSGISTYLTCLVLIAGLLVVSKVSLAYMYPQSNQAQSLGMLLVATTVLFIFQPIKKRIHVLFDKLFSVGWYDSQQLLKTMGAMLAGELQIDSLLKRSLKYLCDELQVSSGEFIIRDTTAAIQRVGYGQWEKRLDTVSYAKLENIENMIIVDEIPTHHGGLVDELEEHAVRIVVPLETRGQRIGYLLLGIKNRGGIFPPKDISLLRILSSQLAVAIVSAQEYAQIKQFNNTLQQEVAEATKDLRNAHKKLQIDDRMKTEFIILTSHNLRTPLAVINGYLSMLKDGSMNIEQQKMLDSMQSSANKLSKFTEDLLVIDSMIAGHQLVLEPVPIEAILRPLIKESEEAALAKGITFETHVDVADVTIEANQPRLSSAIRNLLDNAIKFTPKGTVTLSAYVSGNLLKITVADTGIGIPASEIPHLFSKFHRATDVMRYDYEGEGIGLYLTNLVVKEHMGTTTVESSVGKGSSFTVSLPIKKIIK